MKEDRLEIVFTGGGVSPATTRAKDVGQVIAAFEDAVATTVIQEHGELRSENVVVSLTSIEEGSLHLKFSAPLKEPVYAAAYKLVAAIQNEEWARLRPEALRKLKEIKRFTARYNCAAQLKTSYEDQQAIAVLTASTQIPASAHIYGETELIGKIRRVGGEEPRVRFQTTQGQTLHCPTTEELAKELAHYLYEQVKVAGVATIDFETLAITDFEITRLVSRHTVSPKAAFAKLSTQFGSYFEDIDDVDAWCERVRHG